MGEVGDKEDKGFDPYNCPLTLTLDSATLFQNLPLGSAS